MKTSLQNELTLADRLMGPTSGFFKPLVKGGVILAAIAAGLLAAQSVLAEHGVLIPALMAKVIEILGYVAGSIAGVSKLTVDIEAVKKEKQLDGI
ncbi:hypothetical protein GCM10028803_53490 [Larkinella knui]|uniref:Uncharacterized protein n=1 Tax=Larkinella knui TaxID=2025310 RepID=A0A3P1CGR1_9BACT|nr:hypothetical protein [Larkinella knui]RRB12445.1 hypothetical protein EHT87_19800 [Larkinella knui]